MIIRMAGRVGRYLIIPNNNPYHSASAAIPCTIEWEDGSTESFTRNQVPQEFLKYPCGTWFEAMVERKEDFSLVRILESKRVEKKKYTPEEMKDFVDSIGTSSDLPDADWE